MFEAAELGQKVAKERYDRELPKLRTGLLAAHVAVKSARVPVIVIVSGADGAGKGEFVHRLNEWLDPRGVETHAFWQRSEEEEERPRYWRYWRALPARGRLGILFGSWYTEPIIRRVYRKSRNSELDTELDRIAAFESMLVKDGALVIKLWFHLSKKAQRRRLNDLEKDPNTHWRVSPVDRKHFKLYDKFVKVSERAIRRTNTEAAPWHIIEAADRRYREWAAGRMILEGIETKLKAASSQNVSAPVKPSLKRRSRPAAILSRIDLSQSLDRLAYEAELDRLQGRLGRLGWAVNGKRISTVAVFEGWDAAGKGSAIRRVTAALDPRLYRIVPVAAPSDEERAQHYLWRFWRQLPRAGRFTIFDRSWYGRVLVERVEGFARENEWQRAYQEINDFEEQLADFGVVVLKFWIHISKDEQLRRFKERQNTPHKLYKITDEDWRNRKQWAAYTEAVNTLVARTSTEYAPWTVVAGNDKRFGRIQILRTFCDRLEAAL